MFVCLFAAAAAAVVLVLVVVLLCFINLFIWLSSFCIQLDIYDGE